DQRVGRVAVPAEPEEQDQAGEARGARGAGRAGGRGGRSVMRGTRRAPGPRHICLWPVRELAGRIALVWGEVRMIMRRAWVTVFALTVFVVPLRAIAQGGSVFSTIPDEPRAVIVEAAGDGEADDTD